MEKDYAKADNRVLMKIIAEQQETNNKLINQINKLQHRLDKLLHLLYGTKTEKQKKPPKENNTDTRQAPPIEKNKNKSSTPTINGRRPLPPELPRVR